MICKQSECCMEMMMCMQLHLVMMLSMTSPITSCDDVIEDVITKFCLLKHAILTHEFGKICSNLAQTTTYFAQWGIIVVLIYFRSIQLNKLNFKLKKISTRFTIKRYAITETKLTFTTKFSSNFGDNLTPRKNDCFSASGPWNRYVNELVRLTHLCRKWTYVEFFCENLVVT